MMPPVQFGWNRLGPPRQNAVTASAVNGAGPASVQAPRFGWSAERPPDADDYHRVLTPDDVTAGEMPTDAFIDSVAESMTGDDDQAPRFALITNTLPVLGSQAAVNRFQLRLGLAVFDRMAPPTVNDGRELMLDCLSRFGRGLVTDRKWHRDGQEEGLLSLAYGPFADVAGGHPRLADLRQSLRDGKSAPMEAYQLVFDQLDTRADRPILMIDNASLCHGATAPRALSDKAYRGVNRLLVNTQRTGHRPPVPRENPFWSAAADLPSSIRQRLASYPREFCRIRLEPGGEWRLLTPEQVTAAEL